MYCISVLFEPVTFNFEDEVYVFDVMFWKFCRELLQVSIKLIKIMYEY